MVILILVLENIGISSYIEAKGNAIDIPETLLKDDIKSKKSNGTQYFEGKLGGCKIKFKRSNK